MTAIPKLIVSRAFVEPQSCKCILVDERNVFGLPPNHEPVHAVIVTPEYYAGFRKACPYALDSDLALVLEKYILEQERI